MSEKKSKPHQLAVKSWFVVCILANFLKKYSWPISWARVDFNPKLLIWHFLSPLSSYGRCCGIKAAELIIGIEQRLLMKVSPLCRKHIVTGTTSFTSRLCLFCFALLEKRRVKHAGSCGIRAEQDRKYEIFGNFSCNISWFLPAFAAFSETSRMASPMAFKQLTVWRQFVPYALVYYGYCTCPS